ncbi:hypothetical protein PspLS_09699 [Pyricularia sp. CBS 133598]|nr:hypothetical protein PspLS_09699 [Pyricularia sp. CBS 133598]
MPRLVLTSTPGSALSHAASLPSQQKNCKDGSRKTVSDILRQDRNTSITVAQLEPKLKEWGVAKNLKLHEWRDIMPRLDELEASGTGYRLLLADHEIPKFSHKSQTHAISIVDSSGHVLWHSSAKLSEQPLLEDVTMSERLAENQVVLRSPLRDEGTLLFPQEPLGTIQFNRILHNYINLPGVTESDAFHDALESSLFPTPPGLQDSIQQPHQSLILRLSQTALTLLPTTALEAAQVFLRRMLQHDVTSHNYASSPAITAQEYPAQQPQDPSLEQVDELLDRLLSLLPRKDVQAIQNDDSVKDDLGSLVRKLLLRSIIDNFAGLEDIPHSAVLGMLRTGPRMRYELFVHLQVSSPALAKTVANAQFRAALETCDVEAAEAIIEASKGKPYAIVPDSIVYSCKIERRSSHRSHRASAMETAVCSGSLSMVRTLLHLNVNVNKTRNTFYYDSALKFEKAFAKTHTLASRLRDCSITIVRLLLDKGANVNAPPARVEGKSALRLAAEGSFVGIAELLLSRGAKPIQDQPLKNMTALVAAAYKGRTHMLQLLWEAGKGGFPVDEIDKATARAQEQGHLAFAELFGLLRSVQVSAARGLQKANHDCV